MATPLIAGSAALVRQYFLSGRYPTGQASANDTFAPSGALVKAVLIGGAAGLSGFEPDTGLPLAPPPSFRQGFGRVQLSQSLPLQVTYCAPAYMMITPAACDIEVGSFTSRTSAVLPDVVGVIADTVGI